MCPSLKGTCLVGDHVPTCRSNRIFIYRGDSVLIYQSNSSPTCYCGSVDRGDHVPTYQSIRVSIFQSNLDLTCGITVVLSSINRESTYRTNRVSLNSGVIVTLPIR